MSDVKILGSAIAKVVPIQQHKNDFSSNDFFSYYANHTNAIMVGFLDNVYNEYLKSEAWNYATISEKAIAEFNYQLLRKFLQNLKR